MSKTSVRRRLLGALAAASLAIAPAMTARADQPGWEMDPAYLSMSIFINVFHVRTEQLASFEDTMVKTGPFEMMSPGFTNERVVVSLAPKGETTTVFTVSRYLDSELANRTETSRRGTVGEFLASDAVTIKATVVGHLLADWGWERDEKPKMTLFRPTEGKSPLDAYGPSVTYLKIGYTGQAASLEFMDGEQDLASIQRTLSERSGLAGATIMKLDDGGGYAVYSEYFQAPESALGRNVDVAATGEAKGMELGVVVENYFGR